jgi:hypothetical protein
MEEGGDGFGHGKPGAFHQLGGRGAGGNGALVDFAHLVSGDGFHVGSVERCWAESNWSV